jgi:hypothetical protein
MKFLWLAGMLIIAATLAAGWLAPPGWNCVLILTFLAVFMWVIGAGICGRPLGILINHRNLMSLSRFQTVLWTLILLSGYLTMALVRIRAWLANPASVPDPLAIQIEGHLWALVGISTASLVGSPLLASTKKAKQPDQMVVANTANTLGRSVQEVNAAREGTLYGNPTIADASLADMFQGDELADTAHIDLAKVQMFFFTIVAVACYAVMLFNQIRKGNSDPANLAEFPKVSDGLVALLAISHAGYLTKKGIDQTKQQ